MTKQVILGSVSGSRNSRMLDFADSGQARVTGYNRTIDPMGKMKLQSWLLLAVLAILVAFAAGIRQGVSVEKKNGKILRLYETVDQKCGVQYLLPETVEPDPKVISIICEAQASGTAAMLTKEGYTPVSVATSGGVMKVWMRAPQELELLINRSMRSMEGMK